jgi:hypothetical protein
MFWRYKLKGYGLYPGPLRERSPLFVVLDR